MVQSGVRQDKAPLLAHLPGLCPPRAQWRLVEAAFESDMAPGGIAVLVPLAGMAAFGVTMQPLWLGWALLGLAAMALRVRLAAAFEARVSGDSLVWEQRQRQAAWAQALLLGLGGAAALLTGSPAASLVVLSCIAFVAGAQSAGATLAGTAKGQAILALGPAIIMAVFVGFIAGHVWALGAAVLVAIELGSCIVMVQRAAAQALAASIALVVREDSALPEKDTVPDAVRDFQRLLGRDQTTGLPNRQGFLHILAAESRRAHDASMPLSLVLVSFEGAPELDVHIDGADSEASGRGAAGDPKLAQAQLAAVVSRIQGTLYRVMDQMACLSPQRLAVLLPFTDALGADVVAHKIAAVLRPGGETSPESVGAWTYACVGAATYAGKGLLPETYLLECAMAAEAVARKQGGDRIARFDPLAADMRWAGDKRLSLSVVPGPLTLPMDAGSTPEFVRGVPL